MCQAEPFISLGFTNEIFPPGVHICQVYASEEERETALLQFMHSGVQAKECTACFSAKTTKDKVLDYLEKQGVNINDLNFHKGLQVEDTSRVYLQNGVFDPERMLVMLAKYYDDSVRNGFSAARVIGEMMPDVEKAPGGHRLLEYECRVSQLLRTHPVTAVCQYSAHTFDGATIMEILRVHPLMVVRGAVVHNPFYVQPETYLERIAKYQQKPETNG